MGSLPVGLTPASATENTAPEPRAATLSHLRLTPWSFRSSKGLLREEALVPIADRRPSCASPCARRAVVLGAADLSASTRLRKRVLLAEGLRSCAAPRWRPRSGVLGTPQLRPHPRGRLRVRRGRICSLRVAAVVGLAVEAARPNRRSTSLRRALGAGEKDYLQTEIRSETRLQRDRRCNSPTLQECCSRFASFRGPRPHGADQPARPAPARRAESAPRVSTAQSRHDRTSSTQTGGRHPDWPCWRASLFRTRYGAVHRRVAAQVCRFGAGRAACNAFSSNEVGTYTPELSCQPKLLRVPGKSRI